MQDPGTRILRGVELKDHPLWIRNPRIRRIIELPNVIVGKLKVYGVRSVSSSGVLLSHPCTWYRSARVLAKVAHVHLAAKLHAAERHLADNESGMSKCSVLHFLSSSHPPPRALIR
jgi:hypothetical protein